MAHRRGLAREVLALVAVLVISAIWFVFCMVLWAGFTVFHAVAGRLKKNTPSFGGG